MEPTTHRQVQNATAPSAGGFRDPDGESGHLFGQPPAMDRSTFDRRQAEFWGTRTNLRVFDHPVVERFARQRVEWLAKSLGGPPPQTALDVGCGDGFGQAYMQRICPVIFGCDASPEMLASNPLPRSRLCRADAYQLPFADQSFDLVYCWELLHHIGEPERVVREMARTARDRVLVCEPNAWNPAMALFSTLVPEERGALRFNPLSLRGIMKRAGLHDIRVCAVGTFTPNRTPDRLSQLLHRLPYRVPWIGMYTIGIGRRG